MMYVFMLYLPIAMLIGTLFIGGMLIALVQR
jgi:hypothetical protein